jgi:hypothetical protein
MLLAERSATRPSTLTPEDGDDPVWIAQRMVLDAGAQAARLRRQASAQAATICEAAERETEIIGRQASAQAAAIREAAEREAAELRATVIKLSARLGELANTDRGGASQEAAGVVRKASARAAAMLAASPAARPRTTPARRPHGPPRQLVAIRVAAAATAALCLFALTAGTTELVLHGFPFFVFRSAGTGETGSKGLQEDQGPGQPDAPRPHHATAKPARRGLGEQRLTAPSGK